MYMLLKSGAGNTLFIIGGRSFLVQIILMALTTTPEA